MKIQVSKDDITFNRYIPFTFFHNGESYEGVLCETHSSIGGWDDISYEITWTDGKPNVGDSVIVDLICRDLYGDDQI